MDKKQQAILDAINVVANQAMKNIKCNYYIDGVITQVNTTTISLGQTIKTYNIKDDCGNVFYNIPARSGFVGNVNDIVQICVKNGDFSRKFIDDKRLC